MAADSGNATLALRMVMTGKVAGGGDELRTASFNYTHPRPPGTFSERDPATLGDAVHPICAQHFGEVMAAHPWRCAACDRPASVVQYGLNIPPGPARTLEWCAAWCTPVCERHECMEAVVYGSARANQEAGHNVTHICNATGCYAEGRKVCSCRRAHYCSVSCQRVHWPKHRATCGARAIAQARGGGGA